MSRIAEYEVKVHSTKDKKKLKRGVKEYEYGTINIRDLELKTHIGKTVKVIVTSPETPERKSSNLNTPRRNVRGG
jgi:hypothetical protein